MDDVFLKAYGLVVNALKERSGSERLLLSVVDDDESMRESLPDLIHEFGFEARAFSSAEEFLSSGSADETSCLILDIAMPGMSGPELHQELKRRGEKIPTIFITGQKDEVFVHECLSRAQRGFSSSHLVTRLCLQPSGARSKPSKGPSVSSRRYHECGATAQL